MDLEEIKKKKIYLHKWVCIFLLQFSKALFFFFLKYKEISVIFFVTLMT